MRFRVEVPDGGHRVPRRGSADAGEQAITLSTAKDVKQGFYDAKVTVTFGDTSYEQPVSLTVAAPGSLVAAYNSTGISDDSGDHDEADYDGGGWSYSRQALAAAGLTAGTQGSVTGGLGFTWPDSPAGRPDNAAATGQTVDLATPASRLSFVGSAVNGSQQTTATVTYDDGSTGSVDLSFTDWTMGGGGGTAQFGNEVVARTAYRNVAGADKDPVATYVFATKPFAAPEGRTITSVKLPDKREPARLHRRGELTHPSRGGRGADCAPAPSRCRSRRPHHGRITQGGARRRTGSERPGHRVPGGSGTSPGRPTRTLPIPRSGAAASPGHCRIRRAPAVRVATAPPSKAKGPCCRCGTGSKGPSPRRATAT